MPQWLTPVIFWLFSIVRSRRERSPFLARSRTRDHNLHQRARIRIAHTKFSPELAHPLAHAFQTDPDPVGPQLRRFLRQSLAVIPHHNQDAVLLVAEDHPTSARLRMPEDVGQSLLHNPENRGLQLGTQTRKVSRLEIEQDINATSFAGSFYVPSQRRRESR